MEEVTLVDEFGKRTRFRGVKLVSEIQDTRERGRPHWTGIDVWKTEAGAFVVYRTTNYRIRHLFESCPRLGDNLQPRTPSEADDYPCPACNRQGLIEPGKGYGVETRAATEVAKDPEGLIKVLSHNNGAYSSLARFVLAEISEQDAAVAELWMEEVVE